MSVLNRIFGKPEAQQQQAPQQQQQQAPNPHIASNPTIPGGASDNMPPANPNPNEPTQSPNEKFAKVWDTPNQPGNNAPSFKLQPEQLQKVTSGLDFAQSINREDLAKISQGGEEAVAALSTILNNVGRDIFSKAAQFSSHLTESGYNMASQTINREMPEAVRRQVSAQEMYTSNPKLRDPSMQPLIQAMQGQFATQHPNATPQEINALVVEYVGTLSEAFKKPEAPQKQGQQNTNGDFSSFIGDFN